MKNFRKICLAVLTLSVVCGIYHANAAFAATSTAFTGSIALETPVKATDVPWENSPALVLDLRLPNLLGNISLWGNLDHRLKNEGFKDFESKFQIGGDIPLTENLILYSFYERRYAYNLTRIVVGCRLNFQGRL